MQVMNVLHQQSLQSYNTFGILARAQTMVRITRQSDVLDVLRDPVLGASPKFVLGGGSNLVLTGDVSALVLKVEIMGRALVAEDDRAYIVEAQAGENWHDFVTWTLERGWPGLENLALIPGCVGACAVQNIGAYGVELQDRFHELDGIDLHTGESFTLNAEQCAFGYRDSIFKHGANTPITGLEALGPHPAQQGATLARAQWAHSAVPSSSASVSGTSTFTPTPTPIGLANRTLITRVRFRLAKKWRAEVGYQDLKKKVHQLVLADPGAKPSPQQIYDWVCEIRRDKLPDPKDIGNAGSFFKNPTVSADQCQDIIAREPGVVHYPLLDGRYKLAAAWLIDACGWRGKTMGLAGVFDKQALVLVNKGTPEHPCTGGEVMTLAKAIQTSVYERFGIRLEPEPVVL
jgi:UDP-N-acetylmuramate dehydrogenase